ncbi:MAG: PEP-CTERM sorting domain-containing protein [Planctomycetota bacterium]
MQRGLNVWTGVALAVGIAVSGPAAALLVSPSLDYRVGSNASLSGLSDADVEDRFRTGFRSLDIDTSASVPGGASATANLDAELTATRWSGTFGSTLSVTGGAGAGSLQIRLDFRLEEPARMVWSGSGTGSSVGDSFSVFLGQRFPSETLVGGGGASMDLTALGAGLPVLEPGSYRLNLSAGSGTIRNGGVLLTPTGQANLTFAFDFVAAGSGLTGDYNGSGAVEQGDLNLVLSNWGQARPFDAVGDPFTTPPVDQEELNRVLSNWGSSNAPSFAGFEVPEPGILAATLVGLSGMLARRRSSC